MIQKALCLLLIPVLASCVSSAETLEGYIGHDIREAEMNNGPPTNIIEMGKDKRIYQWSFDQSYSVPARTSYYGGYEMGNGYIVDNRQAVTTGGYSRSYRCLYNIFTEREGDRWIITDYQIPQNGC